MPVLHILASILAWASSVINPFIYAFSNGQYRSAYRQLICGSSRTGRMTSATQTHSRSSGRTFLTDMLHYTTHAEKVKVIRAAAIASAVNNGNEINSNAIDIEHPMHQRIWFLRFQIFCV